MLQILIKKTFILMAPYPNLSLLKKGQIQYEAGLHLEHVQKQSILFIYLLLDKLF